jgi:hypothetical protein
MLTLLFDQTTTQHRKAAPYFFRIRKQPSVLSVLWGLCFEPFFNKRREHNASGRRLDGASTQRSPSNGSGQRRRPLACAVAVPRTCGLLGGEVRFTPGTGTSTVFCERTIARKLLGSGAANSSGV